MRVYSVTYFIMILFSISIQIHDLYLDDLQTNALSDILWSSQHLKQTMRSRGITVNCLSMVKWLPSDVHRENKIVILTLKSSIRKVDFFCFFLRGGCTCTQCTLWLRSLFISMPWWSQIVDFVVHTNLWKEFVSNTFLF